MFGDRQYAFVDLSVVSVHYLCDDVFRSSSETLAWTWTTAVNKDKKTARCPPRARWSARGKHSNRRDENAVFNNYLLFVSRDMSKPCAWSSNGTADYPPSRLWRGQLIVFLTAVFYSRPITVLENSHILYTIIYVTVSQKPRVVTFIIIILLKYTIAAVQLSFPSVHRIILGSV